MPSFSSLDKRNDVISVMVVVSHGALVFAPVFIAAFLGPGWWFLLCWAIFGLTMNGLLNLMHEAAHYHVFRHRAANDVLGRWLLGPLTLADFDAYRQRHWDHHRRLGESNDPKTTYHVDVHGPHAVYLLFRCLVLVEAAQRFRLQRSEKPTPDSASRGIRWILRLTTGQALLFAGLCAAAGAARQHGYAGSIENAAMAYLVVYVYGLASITVLAATMRAIAEHQASDDLALHQGAAALRNFSCSVITRAIFGAYGFGEHATHHERPAFPYYRLKDVTKELVLIEKAYAPTYGYWTTLSGIVRGTAAQNRSLRSAASE